MSLKTIKEGEQLSSQESEQWDDQLQETLEAPWEDVTDFLRDATDGSQHTLAEFVHAHALTCLE
ncbi:hypothetical protein HDU86_008151 [Geranomyces michiganensis]|nr:hypothetical protein HDU86_008151 [Geranomyces michiganensis]